MSTPLFLGLDCGGSSTRALVQDSEGNTVFRGEAGPANLSTTPNDELQANLSKALLNAPQPNFACACFAGLATEDDRQRATNILAQLFPKATLRIERDYPAAFAASPEGTDVCVIAGTGSLVCSRAQNPNAESSPNAERRMPNAEFEKSGGNGYVLGDDGSAFQYGRALLRHHIDLDKLNEIADALTEIFGASEREAPWTAR